MKEKLIEFINEYMNEIKNSLTNEEKTFESEESFPIESEFEAVKCGEYAALVNILQWIKENE